MSRVIKFRAWGPNCKIMWDWDQVKNIANKLGWENFDQGERKLMQFTGLHDINGVELYDGDIIADEEGLSKIYWSDKDFMWCASDVGGLCELAGADFKVIGNIYQNPEFLERAK